MHSFPSSFLIFHFRHPQKYRHVDNVQVVDKKCLDRFVQNWLRHKEKVQYFAYLYGRYERREGAHGVREIAFVYALYAPKQRFLNGQIELSASDPYRKAADAVARHLGLCIIGAIYTRPPQKERITAVDVELIGKLQWRERERDAFCSRFVSVVVERNESREIEPFAYMLSDQCMCMVRDGLLESPRNGSELCHVRSRTPAGELLSVVIRNDAKMGSQEVTEFEAIFFLVELTISLVRAGKLPLIFARNDFPAVNSEEETRDTLLSGYFWNS